MNALLSVRLPQRGQNTAKDDKRRQKTTKTANYGIRQQNTAKYGKRRQNTATQYGKIRQKTLFIENIYAACDEIKLNAQIV